MVVHRRLCHLGLNALTSVFGGAAACAIFNVGIPRDDRWDAACLAMLANQATRLTPSSRTSLAQARAGPWPMPSSFVTSLLTGKT